MAQLLRCWVEARRSGAEIGNILACAETNIAVDNLMRKLLDIGVVALRIGDSKNVRLDLREFTLEERVKQLKLEGNKVHPRKLLKTILQTVEVVCCTCSSAGSGLLKKFQFSHLVIDEVAQAIGK